MNRKRNILAGLLAVLLAAAVGYVVYRFRDEITAFAKELKEHICGSCRCLGDSEYDDYDDV